MQISLKESNMKHSSSFVVESVSVDQIKLWREELDTFYQSMREFPLMEIGEVLLSLSSFSARMNGIRSQIVRSESRLMNSFRTKEIDPFIEECDRQFKIHSRLMSVHSLDWEMSRGQ